MTEKILIGAISSTFVTIIGVIYWTARTRVDMKLCDRTHKAVDQEHRNLRNYVKDSEERAEERHKELKQDLRDLKNLVKNGACK